MSAGARGSGNGRRQGGWQEQASQRSQQQDGAAAAGGCTTYAAGTAGAAGKVHAPKCTNRALTRETPVHAHHLARRAHPHARLVHVLGDRPHDGLRGGEEQRAAQCWAPQNGRQPARSTRMQAWRIQPRSSKPAAPALRQTQRAISAAATAHHVGLGVALLHLLERQRQREAVALWGAKRRKGKGRTRKWAGAARWPSTAACIAAQLVAAQAQQAQQRAGAPPCAGPPSGASCS